MPRKFQLSVHRFRKVIAATVSAQHTSVVSAVVCVASDLSISPKSVKGLKVPVPLTRYICDFEVSTKTKLKRE